MRRSQGMAFWSLTVAGSPVLHQRRQFVRAGGGETVELTNRWSGAQTGEVTDLSEGGLRCRFGYADLKVGETVAVTVRLGDDVLAVDGWVLRSVDDIAARAFDVTVTFDLNEQDAALVRRYVIQQQILARRAAADAAY